MNSALQAYRNYYAQFVVASAGSSNERLISAFATTSRELHVGPGPWLVWTGANYVQTISEDPRHLYQDIVVGLLPERGINNGQPSLHAGCLSAIDPALGETAIHIGAGTGYYSALLAKLVGPSGKVEAYETDPTLAERGSAVLGGMRNVRFHCLDATENPLTQADIIYVNAGVTNLPDQWFDALNPCGRLLAPLTPDQGYGGMIMVTRRTDEHFDARILARVAFIPCTRLRDASESAALAAAFEPRGFRLVKSLRRNTEPDDSAWYVSSTWWLSMEGVAA